MIITTCGNSQAIAKSLARKLKAKYSPLTISTFPDGDEYLKFNTNVKGHNVVIVQSFQPNPQRSFLQIIFAAETAKDLGAKHVTLIAPFLAYMRQDARFNPGEAISSKIVGKYLSKAVDRLITFDPHIHRYKSLRDVFSIKSTKLTANYLIADYIKKHYKDVVIVGPDWEAYQWADKIAKLIGAKAAHFSKRRHSSRRVTSKMVNAVDMKGKTVIIIDDIISTGGTVIQATKTVLAKGAKQVHAICIHGLFVENALSKMKKSGVKSVLTTNCIEHKTNKIDVTPLLVKELKK
jgi:ribose-phosphate pyrophosphokinase